MNKVDWTKWSAIAEIFSSLAIMLTLIYLALQTQQLAFQNEQLVAQVQQNTVALRASTIQAIAHWSWETYLPSLANENLREAITAACIGTPTDDQRRMFETFLTALLRIHVNRFYQVQEGILSEEDSLSLGGRGGLLSGAYFSEYWPRIKDRYAPEFQEYIERQVIVDPPVPCF